MKTSSPEVTRCWPSWSGVAASLLLIAAASGIAVSPRFVYWDFQLRAPQYPKGLRLSGYPDRIEGDVREIDLLNHYIGMKPLGGAAPFERRVAKPAIGLVAALTLIAAFWPSRASIVLLLPAILFPAAFLIDLQGWLRYYGLSLDPRAPLSSSVKPFVPPALGDGKIGNFRTFGAIGPGLGLAMASSGAAIVAAGLRWRRRRRAVPIAAVPATRAVATVGMTVPFFLASAGAALGAPWTVSPTGPIRTIEDAIARADAGDTIVVDGGRYSGPLLIEKSVRLVGRNAPVIDGEGNGTVVTIAAPDVRLSGFVIRGSGDVLGREDSGLLVRAPRAVVEKNAFEDVLFGVTLQRAPETVVRDNDLQSKPLDLARRGDLIRVWYSDDVTLESNRIRDGRDMVLWFSKRLTVRANRAHGGRYGLHFMYCQDARVESNHLWDNSVGAFLMYSRHVAMTGNWLERNRGASGHGIGLKDMDAAQIADNVVLGNRIGVFVENSRGTFERNIVAHNEVGLTILPSARGNRFERNSFVENGEQVAIVGASGRMTTNAWQGNYWSDYRGYDVDGDGQGDQAYEPSRLFERLADRNAALRLFRENPSVAAIDFASRVFPVFKPKPTFTDAAPRMTPVASSLEPPRRAARLPWLVVAAGMLCWPTVVLVGSLVAPRSRTSSPSGAGTSDIEREETSRHGIVSEKAIRANGPRGDSTSTASDPRGAIAEPTGRPDAANATRPLSDTALRVDGLTKRFRRVTAVDDLSFEVRRGEAVVLWGVNGAGKTTVLRCLLGLLPHQGSATVFGHRCRAGGRAARRMLGYVPQEVRLHVDQTVAEAVRFYARLRRVDPNHAMRLLDEWELGDARNRAVGHLSGGMKQKLALVLALLADPPMLLLDEPTSNLDAHARHEFARLLQRLKQAGKTLLFCSHRVSEVRRLADRVIVLERGRKIAEGAPDAIAHHLRRPGLLALTLAAEHGVAATAILVEAGFRVETNATHLLVDVPAGRRAEPIRLLAEHQVPIEDFELDDERHADTDRFNEREGS
ncbi:MAG: nitrous oxide reductase family maturation protein NosD [Planctomycetes bacterium]|nr:nitrous oxide reductase family maturation protein NosD [Planctomycetota bacterium]